MLQGLHHSLLTHGEPVISYSVIRVSQHWIRLWLVIGQHWFRLWLVTYSSPVHHFSQYWLLASVEQILHWSMRLAILPCTRHGCIWHLKLPAYLHYHRKQACILALQLSVLCKCIGCQLDEHSLMTSLVTTSRMHICFNVLTDIYHEFLLLFHCCILLEIKLTTTTTI